jgi:hypothetical protein
MMPTKPVIQMHSLQAVCAAAGVTQGIDFCMKPTSKSRPSPFGWIRTHSLLCPLDANGFWLDISE